MSTRQKLPATGSISLAEARATGLLDLWKPRRAKNNAVRAKKTTDVKRQVQPVATETRLKIGEVVGLVLPWSPSVNHYYKRHIGGVSVSADGKRYQRQIASLVMANRWVGLVGSALVDVAIVLHEPDNGHVHDCDNYYKSLFDALTKAGLWTDDSQVKSMRVVMAAPVKKGRIEMAVRLHVPSRSDDVLDLFKELGVWEQQ